MHYAEFKGINTFLVGMSRILLKEGINRKTRGNSCFEIPNPVMIKITNPTARVVSLPERKWNTTLPFVESLWLASGRNDMQMVGHYVKKLYNYSDDKITMRGGYGPRFRFFNGVAEDYNIGYLQQRSKQINKKTIEIDQFRFIEECFIKDQYTRQAVISIADPAKDCFSEGNVLKKTNDFPCTRSIHFQRNGNKLDLTVHMRSNDFIWGASGVNIFNCTFIQEYFAQILRLEIGSYYHIADNFHYYERFKQMLTDLASIDYVKDEEYIYKKSFKSLNEFDERLEDLQKYEKDLRETTLKTPVDFGDDFFNDWANIFFLESVGSLNAIKFKNPILESIAKQKLTKKKLKENKKQFMNTFLDGPSLNFGTTEIQSWKNYI